MSVIAIVELSSFSKRAAKILDKEEVDALRAYLLQHPDKGDVIPGTGAVSANCGGQPVAGVNAAALV